MWRLNPMRQQGNLGQSLANESGCDSFKQLSYVLAVIGIYPKFIEKSAANAVGFRFLDGAKAVLTNCGGDSCEFHGRTHVAIQIG